MLKTLLAVFLVFQFVHGIPFETNSLQCSACQYLAIGAGLSSGKTKNESISHCKQFKGCEKELDECEIMKQVHEALKSHDGGFAQSHSRISKTISKCYSDSKARVISEDPTIGQCTLCFLVYDALKYINYNILENPMLEEVKEAIEYACGTSLINNGLCQAVIEEDALGVIVQGLKDSLGGFYDLIAVQGFGCPAYADLFGTC